MLLLLKLKIMKITACVNEDVEDALAGDALNDDDDHQHYLYLGMLACCLQQVSDLSIGQLVPFH